MAHRCTHQQYFEEIATEANVIIPESLLERCRKSQDQYLNDVPLNLWDMHAAGFKYPLSKALKARGDFFSLAGGVCSLKAMARAMLAKETETA